MATTRIFAPQNNLTAAASLFAGPNVPIESGDPLTFGDGLVPCVALVDQDSDDEVTAEFGQTFTVHELAVVGTSDDGTTGAAIAAGDLVYADTDGALNVDSTAGSVFGTALGAVASGATTVIRVAVGLGA